VFSVTNFFGNAPYTRRMDVRGWGFTTGTVVQQWNSPCPVANQFRAQLFLITHYMDVGTVSLYTIRPLTNSNARLRPSAHGGVELGSFSASDGNNVPAEYLWTISGSNNTGVTIRSSLNNQQLASPLDLSGIPNFNDGAGLTTIPNNAPHQNRARWILNPYAGPALRGVNFHNYPSAAMTVGSRFAFNTSQWTSVMTDSLTPMYWRMPPLFWF
jgi:hypothetical protein